MADGGELRGELFFYRHSVGEPSPSFAICESRSAATGLVELRAPFAVSLVPVSTSWVAVTRFAAARVTVYAAVFVLVNSAYVAFVWEVLAQAEVQNKVSPRMRRVTRVRSVVTLGMFAIATIVSLKFPVWGFVLSALCLVCSSAAGSSLTISGTCMKRWIPSNPTEKWLLSSD